ncbi:LytTR family transcriptional regulator, partial [Vibrio cholerae O1]|nr:LytTR family transcriptional regulator [Vibrio cholerae O1]
LNSDKQFKIRYSHIFYLDYVDRNVCIYTEKETYWLKSSIASLVPSMPNNLTQVSKSTAVNIFQIKQVESTLNGNLILSLTTKEKIIVSRRYVKKLKNKLEKMV